MNACRIRVKMVDIVVTVTMATPAPVSRATWASIVKSMWLSARRVSTSDANRAHVHVKKYKIQFY